MTETLFNLPSEAGDQVVPGKVRRSKDGRPYVRNDCPNGCDGGRVPSEKREGKTVQCPKCKGKGFFETLYTRCTSFVGVLDDRTSLEKWKLRIVLTGLGVDHELLEALAASDPDDRDRLDELADLAFAVGEGHAAANKGTDLHELSTFIERGEPLPATLTDWETGEVRPVTLQDRADMAAWKRIRDALVAETLGVECFVVEDGYRIGGTYDRRVRLKDPLCWCKRPNILDLKTGRVDYGAGKMAQQLAVYAHGSDYDPDTGKRGEQDVCIHVGIVVHLPQGTGDATVLPVDLVEGWAAVALSARVRNYRRVSPQWLGGPVTLKP